MGTGTASKILESHKSWRIFTSFQTTYPSNKLKAFTSWNQPYWFKFNEYIKLNKIYFQFIIVNEICSLFSLKIFNNWTFLLVAHLAETHRNFSGQHNKDNTTFQSTHMAVSLLLYIYIVSSYTIMIICLMKTIFGFCWFANDCRAARISFGRKYRRAQLDFIDCTQRTHTHIQYIFRWHIARRNCEILHDFARLSLLIYLFVSILVLYFQIEKKYESGKCCWDSFWWSYICRIKFYCLSY